VKPGGYRKWAAILHEIVLILCKRTPDLRNNNLITALLAHTFSDRIEWKTENTLRDVDTQVANIQELWASNDPQPVINFSDELMGELRISAPWLETHSTPNSDECSTPNPPN
jgi:hypothetical protein